MTDYGFNINKNKLNEFKNIKNQWTDKRIVVDTKALKKAQEKTDEAFILIKKATSSISSAKSELSGTINNLSGILGSIRGVSSNIEKLLNEYDVAIEEYGNFTLDEAILNLSMDGRNLSFLASSEMGTSEIQAYLERTLKKNNITIDELNNELRKLEKIIGDIGSTMSQYRSPIIDFNSETKTYEQINGYISYVRDILSREIVILVKAGVLKVSKDTISSYIQSFVEEFTFDKTKDEREEIVNYFGVTLTVKQFEDAVLYRVLCGQEEYDNRYIENLYKTLDSEVNDYFVGEKNIDEYINETKAVAKSLGSGFDLMLSNNVRPPLLVESLNEMVENGSFSQYTNVDRENWITEYQNIDKASFVDDILFNYALKAKNEDFIEYLKTMRNDIQSQITMLEKANYNIRVFQGLVDFTQIMKRDDYSSISQISNEMNLQIVYDLTGYKFSNYIVLSQGEIDVIKSELKKYEDECNYEMVEKYNTFLSYLDNYGKKNSVDGDIALQINFLSIMEAYKNNVFDIKSSDKVNSIEIAGRIFDFYYGSQSEQRKLFNAKDYGYVYDHMTDEDKGIYNAYFNTGQYAKADEFLYNYRAWLYEKEGARQAEEIFVNLANGGNFNDALTIFKEGLGDGWDGSFKGLQNLFLADGIMDESDCKKIEMYSVLSSIADCDLVGQSAVIAKNLNVSQDDLLNLDIDNALKHDIINKEQYDNIKSYRLLCDLKASNSDRNFNEFLLDTYGFGSSMGNMLPSVMMGLSMGVLSLPSLGRVLAISFMGSSVTGNKHEELLQRDVVGEKNWLISGTVGLSEVFLGSILGSIPGLSLLEKTFLFGCLGEGIEEFSQEWIEDSLESAILNKPIIYDETMKNAKKAFVMGALMSATFNGGTAIINFGNRIYDFKLTSFHIRNMNKIDFDSKVDYIFANSLPDGAIIDVDGNIVLPDGRIIRTDFDTKAALKDRIENATPIVEVSPEIPTLVLPELRYELIKGLKLNNTNVDYGAIKEILAINLQGKGIKNSTEVVNTIMAKIKSTDLEIVKQGISMMEGQLGLIGKLGLENISSPVGNIETLNSKALRERIQTELTKVAKLQNDTRKANNFDVLRDVLIEEFSVKGIKNPTSIIDKIINNLKNSNPNVQNAALVSISSRLGLEENSFTFNVNTPIKNNNIQLLKFISSLEEGNLTLPDGAIVGSGNDIVLLDGTVIDKSGTVVLPNGEAIKLDFKLDAIEMIKNSISKSQSLDKTVPINLPVHNIELIERQIAGIRGIIEKTLNHDFKLSRIASTPKANGNLGVEILVNGFIYKLEIDINSNPTQVEEIISNSMQTFNDYHRITDNSSSTLIEVNKLLANTGLSLSIRYISFINDTVMLTLNNGYKIDITSGITLEEISDVIDRIVIEETINVFLTKKYSDLTVSSTIVNGNNLKITFNNRNAISAPIDSTLAEILSLVNEKFSVDKGSESYNNYIKAINEHLLNNIEIFEIYYDFNHYQPLQVTKILETKSGQLLIEFNNGFNILIDKTDQGIDSIINEVQAMLLADKALDSSTVGTDGKIVTPETILRFELLKALDVYGNTVANFHEIRKILIENGTSNDVATIDQIMNNLQSNNFRKIIEGIKSIESELGIDLRLSEKTIISSESGLDISPENIDAVVSISARVTRILPDGFTINNVNTKPNVRGIVVVTLKTINGYYYKVEVNANSKTEIIEATILDSIETFNRYNNNGIILDIVNLLANTDLNLPIKHISFSQNTLIIHLSNGYEIELSNTTNHEELQLQVDRIKTSEEINTLLAMGYSDVVVTRITETENDILRIAFNNGTHIDIQNGSLTDILSQVTTELSLNQTASDFNNNIIEINGYLLENSYYFGNNQELKVVKIRETSDGDILVVFNNGLDVLVSKGDISNIISQIQDALAFEDDIYIMEKSNPPIQPIVPESQVLPIVPEPAIQPIIPEPSIPSIVPEPAIPSIIPEPITPIDPVNSSFPGIKKIIIPIIIFISIILPFIPWDTDEEKERTLTLELFGSKVISLYLNNNYIEPGYRAIDSIDGDVTNEVVVTGKVNIHQLGTYVLNYTITHSGNTVTKNRTVRILNLGIPDDDIVPPLDNPVLPPIKDSPPSITIIDVTPKSYNGDIHKYKVYDGVLKKATILSDEFIQAYKFTKERVYGVGLISIIKENNMYQDIYTCSKAILNNEASRVIITNRNIESSYYEINCFTNRGMFYFTDNDINFKVINNQNDYNEVINSNTRNTFVYETVLVNQGVSVNNSNTNTSSIGLCKTSTALRLFVPNESKSYKSISETMVKNGCQKGILLPSNNVIVYKSSYSDTINVIHGKNNMIDSGIYFVTEKD